MLSQFRSCLWQRKYFESYLVIAVIYFVLCFVFNRLFTFLEKKVKKTENYALAVEYMENP